MLPTMKNIEGEFNMYYRDCWSHRLVWFNIAHLEDCFSRLLSGKSTSDTKGAISFKRPWKKGDIITMYNPYTRSIVTKRIIAVGGDTVQVFGEYAKQFHGAESHGDSCGVPDDGRFPDPYCQRIVSARKENATSNNPGATVIVPSNNVWVEGDNPLESTDSRHYGPVPEAALRGRITMQLWPMSNLSFVCSERPEEEWIKDMAV